LLRGGLFQRGFRFSIAALAAVAALVALATDACARRSHRSHSDESYDPPYSSIVVDVNSGAVMQASNADAPRHPASLTKIMTLYLLFERLEQGKIKLTTELPVSARAAAQAPSKLALKPGESIRVETAIRAIVTKSANDVAVVVAEALGGDEATFAKMMTAKARALGMNQTVYRNASGLPDDQQITTARDQAILGRAIQDRFPNYYHYFATRTFSYRGHEIRNHNHLLGTIDGVDGIKTGYIKDSGFNIVTSVRRGNHHVVAVVFGGRSAQARDARVRSLIDNNINIAAVKRTAPPIVEGWEIAQARKERRNREKDDDHTGSAPIRVASVARSSSDAPLPGSTEPIKPNAVKTVAVHPGTMRTAALSPLPIEARQLTPMPAESARTAITTISTVKSEQVPAIAPDTPTPSALNIRELAAVKPDPAPVAAVAAISESVPLPPPTAEPPAKSRSGWIIQIGALPEEKEARQRLDLALMKARDILAKADPFTERIEKGDKILFRARFAGLDRHQAEAACKHLKRSDIPCMVLKD